MRGLKPFSATLVGGYHVLLWARLSPLFWLVIIGGIGHVPRAPSAQIAHSTRPEGLVGNHALQHLLVGLVGDHTLVQLFLAFVRLRGQDMTAKGMIANH